MGPGIIPLNSCHSSNFFSTSHHLEAKNVQQMEDAEVIALGEYRSNNISESLDDYYHMIRNSWVIHKMYREGDVVLLEGFNGVPSTLRRFLTIYFGQYQLSSRYIIKGWDSTSALEEMSKTNLKINNIIQLMRELKGLNFNSPRWTEVIKKIIELSNDTFKITQKPFSLKSLKHKISRFLSANAELTSEEKMEDLDGHVAKLAKASESLDSILYNQRENFTKLICHNYASWLVKNCNEISSQSSNFKKRNQAMQDGIKAHLTGTNRVFVISNLSQWTPQKENSSHEQNASIKSLKRFFNTKKYVILEPKSSNTKVAEAMEQQIALDQFQGYLFYFIFKITKLALCAIAIFVLFISIPLWGIPGALAWLAWSHLKTPSLQEAYAELLEISKANQLSLSSPK